MKKDENNDKSNDDSDDDTCSYEGNDKMMIAMTTMVIMTTTMVMIDIMKQGQLLVMITEITPNIYYFSKHR